jgi:Predicted enzyme related to lactoylglutathione lyase
MKSSINWFEVPVKDMNRAKKFYSALLGKQLEDMPMPGSPLQYAVFPYEQDLGVGGVLVYGEGYTPSTEGTLLYFECGNNISGALSRVENAGGRVVLPKTSIGPYGFIAHFIDSEGNKAALHSRE